MTKRSGDLDPPNDQADEDVGTQPDVSDIPDLDFGYKDTWLLIVAGLLGIVTVGIVAAAIVVTRSTGVDQPAVSSSATQSAEPQPTEESPLANIDCNDTFIVEIARSNPPFEQSPVQEALSSTDGAKYLEADASCATYERAGQRLIAYVGPFDTLSEACAAQRDTEDVAAVPRRMNAEQQGRSYCNCEVDAPTLRQGAGSGGDVAVLLAIAEVQGMLKTLGFFEPAIDGTPYGPMTSTGVREFQLSEGLETTGNVNQATWAAFREVTYDGDRGFCDGTGT